jgi:hypothetical protein
VSLLAQAREKNNKKDIMPEGGIVLFVGGLVALLLIGGIIFTMLEFRRMYETGKDDKIEERDRNKSEKGKPKPKTDLRDEF